MHIESIDWWSPLWRQIPSNNAYLVQIMQPNNRYFKATHYQFTVWISNPNFDANFYVFSNVFGYSLNVLLFVCLLHGLWCFSSYFKNAIHVYLSFIIISDVNSFNFFYQSTFVCISTLFYQFFLTMRAEYVFLSLYSFQILLCRFPNKFWTERRNSNDMTIIHN